MRNFIWIFVSGIIFFLSGCSKKSDSSIDTNPAPSTSKITITDFQKTENCVRITWSKVENSDFTQYCILRRTYRATDTTRFYSPEIIGTTSLANLNSFTDYEVPAALYVEYQVVADCYNKQNHATNRIFSNVRSLERPELKKFSFNPKDILHDAVNHRIYVIDNDSGKIAVLDYETREITSKIKTFANLGFSSLGIFNGAEELYVPRNDGWIYIYNANTLEKIDQFRAGVSCNSVVFNNGKLFVSVDSNYNNYTLKVFGRAGKNLISNTVINSIPDHLAVVPGSDTKLFGIGYYRLFSFEYDANGHSVSNNSGTWSSYYNNSRIFEVLPDGQGLITFTNGSIYSGSLNLVQTLPFGNYSFTSYAFNSSLTSVFAGCSNYNNVVEYSYQNYSELHTYPCIGYPAAVFTDNANLIVLSNVNSYSGYGTTDFYLESIPIVE